MSAGSASRSTSRHRPACGMTGPGAWCARTVRTGTGQTSVPSAGPGWRKTVGRVAVCGAHGPPRLPDTGGGASVPPVGRPAIASDRRKVWRDRTRRRAIRRLTDLHRDEYLQLLAEEREPT